MSVVVVPVVAASTFAVASVDTFASLLIAVVLLLSWIPVATFAVLIGLSQNFLALFS